MSKPKTAQNRRVRLNVELSAEQFEALAADYSAACQAVGLSPYGTMADGVEIMLHAILTTELEMRASRAAIQRAAEER